MKKLLLLTLSVAFVGLSYAQDCTPQINWSANTIGLNPNPPWGSVAGVAYDEVNTLVIPGKVDNTLTGPPGDSIQLCAIGVVAINNMPPGYAYDVWAYHDDGLTLPYDVIALPGTSADTIHVVQTSSITRVCIRLKNPTPPPSSNMADGLPDRDTAVISVIVGAYANAFGCTFLGSAAQDTFEVHLAIKDAVYAGVDEETGFGFTVQTNYPNPATDFTNIRFATPTPTEVSINVYDAVGRNVHSFVGTSYAGENKYGLSTENFKAGVYMYSITCNGKTISKKMLVSK